MVDTQSAYDNLLAWDTTTKWEYNYFTDNLLNLFVWWIIQDHIVNWIRHKQSKAKWHLYTADIPIIPLQNILTILPDKSIKSRKSYLPYLFGYKLILAISRDPKLLTQKINLINTNCKCIILGCKLRGIFGLEVYRRPWNIRKNTKWQWL